MSYSNIAIANLALTLLSTSRIMSLTQDDENARKINAIFDMTRDALLFEHNWNFARAERTLALSSTTPTTEDWTYAFALPADCLRVRRLEDDEPFAIFENLLYTNADTAVIEYTKKITDPSKFSMGFVNAFASRLAADLAFGITQNATLAKNLYDKAKLDLREAKWSDAQEGSATPAISGSLINERAK